MTTYHRVHRADRVDDLLDPSTWVSDVWSDEPVYHTCDDCGGRGEVDWWNPRLEDYEAEECPTCRGNGRWVEPPRRGVSVCRSLGQLYAYMRDRNPDLTDAVVVEIEADEAEEEDLDAADGAVLVYPRRIVSVLPVGETPLADLRTEED